MPGLLLLYEQAPFSMKGAFLFELVDFPRAREKLTFIFSLALDRKASVNVANLTSVRLSSRG
jgi:hypothetical protein